MNLLDPPPFLLERATAGTDYRRITEGDRLISPYEIDYRLFPPCQLLQHAPTSGAPCQADQLNCLVSHRCSAHGPYYEMEWRLWGSRGVCVERLLRGQEALLASDAGTELLPVWEVTIARFRARQSTPPSHTKMAHTYLQCRGMIGLVVLSEWPSSKL